MNLEDLRDYCLSLPRTEEAIPFEDAALVFKVCGKWFCLVFLQGDLRINIKCAADEIDEMRERFPAVTAGFRMNKKYWNTVLLDGSISDSTLKGWIRKSYRLVISGLTQQESGTA
ncbi:MAG: MmcQ/YjbR family DNA-binding protein [Culturomica sp.]|nr:MmcQ/YjbR family DNA-binding protein [Culturomica sp.]